MTRAFARILGVRPGEGTRLALVAALFATIEIGRGLGEVGADTLVVSRLGPSALPGLYIGLGLVSLVAAIAFGAALGRLRRGPLLVGFLGGAALGIVALGLLARMMGTGAEPVAWLAVFATGTIGGTICWTVAGAVFDAREAKRLFPICTAAAIAGGFGGTLVAGPVARLAGTEALIVGEAILLGLAAVLLRWITLPVRPVRPGSSVVGELRAGFDAVAGSHLLRLVAAAYVVFSILNFSVTFSFFKAMDRAFPDEADLATAIGLLSAAITGASFVVSLVVAPRLYARLGVATSALLLPVIYLAGFAIWLAQFTITTAAGLRVAQQVTQRGVSNAAWSAFYNVVPGARRAQVLAFMDGVPGQLGIALSGLLLLATAGSEAGTPVFAMGLVAALLCTAIVLGIRRRYADSLLRTLRSGMGERLLEGGPGLSSIGGSHATAALVAGLAAPEATVRRTAAELLGRVSGPAAVSALAEAVDDPDPGVRVAAIDALVAIRSPATEATSAIRRFDDPAPAVRAAAIRATAVLDQASLESASGRLGADPDPHVRAALAVALVRAGEEERPHAILEALLEADAPAERICGLEAVGMLGGHAPSARMPDHLRDPDPGVRAAAIRAIGAFEGTGTYTQAILDALDDDATAVRRAAALVLRARPSPPPQLVDVLLAGSPREQDAALAALDGHGPTVRSALLDWSARQVTRASMLRSQRAGLGAWGDGPAADVEGGSTAFLASLLGKREAGIQVRLLRALGVLGAPDAGGLIRRCLRSNDPETRAQAIEAIDSIGDAALRRAIVGLLDDAPAAGRADRDRVLGELAEDPDPWVRALAMRAQGERLHAAWSTLQERGRTDPSAIVRDAVRPLSEVAATAMPDAIRSLDDIDRMLFLRRVPLFRELEPEDLQRIASATTEAWYEAGEPLVREGDLGNDMVILVEGNVRVIRLDPDGTERELTRYGPGDHIGELALLRERPRAATVIALDPGVRGLVIDGEGLMAMLRERPEAAMAMLATLAERLTEQS